MIVGRARAVDAPGIARVHVAAWRSAYANLLPADYLAGMSVMRQTAMHQAAILAGRGVLVARSGNNVVGFCTVGRPRTSGLGEGEIETLYVLDDWREQGLGRRLLQAGAKHLADAGVGSAFLWVLQDNPSRWFYERMGGRNSATSKTQVAGQSFTQTAYLWNPIGLLMSASTQDKR